MFLNKIQGRILMACCLVVIYFQRLLNMQFFCYILDSYWNLSLIYQISCSDLYHARMQWILNYSKSVFRPQLLQYSRITSKVICCKCIHLRQTDASTYENMSNLLLKSGLTYIRCFRKVYQTLIYQASLEVILTITQSSA